MYIKLNWYYFINKSLKNKETKEYYRVKKKPLFLRLYKLTNNKKLVLILAIILLIIDIIEKALKYILCIPLFSIFQKP